MKINKIENALYEASYLMRDIPIGQEINEIRVNQRDFCYMAIVESVSLITSLDTYSARVDKWYIREDLTDIVLEAVRGFKPNFEGEVKICNTQVNYCLKIY